ncbi:MAG: c-type cytochrome domain-containing protein [Planctomycetota bacterium]
MKFQAKKTILLIWLGLGCLLFLDQSTIAQEKKEAKITFDNHVKPILLQRCSSCHNAQKREGDLDVTNYTNLMQGGGSGPVIEPQDSASSYLYELITYAEAPEMPPSGKIPDPEIQLIAKWIDMGALENMGSKAKKAKPKLDMTLSGDATKRPDIIPLPIRIPLEPVIHPPRASVSALATSPWAPIVAVAAPKQILLYNSSNLQMVGVLPLEERIAHSLKFSRSGQLLLAGGGKDGARGKTVLFDAIKGEKIMTLGEELDSILASDISPGHDFVAMGGPNKLVKLFSLDGELVSEIKKHTEWVTALEFSPDGKYFASGDRNGGLFVWEADSGNEVFGLKGHSKAITGISWRIDGKILATSSEDATIRVWELENGRQLKSWGAHGGGATSIEFLRNGQIASTGRDKVAKIWDQNGKLIKQFTGLTDVGVSVTYCDESNRIFAADWQGNVRAWNATDGKHVGNIQANPPSMAQQLKSAQQSLAQAKSQHAPIANQVAQTTEKINQTEQELNSAKQVQVGIQNRLNQSQQQFNVAKAKLDSTTVQQAQWKTELERNRKAFPLLQQTAEKSKAAVELLPQDAELTKANELIQSKLALIENRVQELDGLVNQSNQTLADARTTMNQLEAKINNSQSEMTNNSQKISGLEKRKQDLTTQLTKQNESAAQAIAKLKKAETEVARWQENISFVTRLDSLKAQLEQQQVSIADQQNLVDAAHAKLSEAQKKVDEAIKKREDLKKSAKDLKDEIQQLRSSN